MAIVEFIPVDDNKALQEAGIKFVAINEPKIIVGCNGNGPFDLDITENWSDKGTKQLKERGREHNLSDDTISHLTSYIGIKVYVDRGEQIAKIVSRRKDETEEDDNEKEQEDEEKKNGKKNKKQEAIDTTVGLVLGKARILFRDEYLTAYMKTLVSDPRRGDHYEVIRIDEKSKMCKLYVSKLYYDHTGGGILKSDALNEAIQTLEAKANFSGEIRKLHLRTAWEVDSIDDNGEEQTNHSVIYYDLCTPHWTCIKIDGNAESWQILPSHPDNIMFLRYGQKPQLTPTHGYREDILDEFLDMMRLTNENDRILFKVWLVGLFIPDKPHPIMIPFGAQGSAKSTWCRFVKRIYDPCSSELLTIPTEKREAAQHAHHHAILIYDNVEKLPEWFSDFICQVVTGADQSQRILYTDNEDFVYNFRRTAILNGLHVPLTKPDALDRSIIEQFERIPENERMEESKIYETFKEMLPHILGKIFDVLARALKLYPTVKLKTKPRMADFATWGAAIARALGGNNELENQKMEQKFLRAYDEVMERQNVDVVEANPIGPALLRWFKYVLPIAQDKDGEFYRNNGFWEGGPGELLAILTAHAEVMGFDKKDREWPKKPFMLVKILKPIVPDLKKAYGLDVHIYRDTKGEKTSKNSSWIEVKYVGETPSTASTASTNPNTRSDSNDSGGGSENAASTQPPPSSSSYTSGQGESGGATHPPGGGSAKTPSTQNVQNHAQNNESGGGGGSGGNLEEKNRFFPNVTLAPERENPNSKVSTTALEECLNAIRLDPQTSELRSERESFTAADSANRMNMPEDQVKERLLFPLLRENKILYGGAGKYCFGSDESWRTGVDCSK